MSDFIFRPDRARRRQPSDNTFDLTGPELAALRSSLGALIGGLTDRQLRLVEADLKTFVERRRDALAIAPDAVAGAWPKGPDLPALRGLGRALRPRRKAPPAPLERRMALLGTMLGLDGVEVAILALLCRISLFEGWTELIGLVRAYGNHATITTIALLTGEKLDIVEQRLAPGGRLQRSGMLRHDDDAEFWASALLRRIGRSRWDDADTLREQLMPAAAPSTLKWDDHAHLGPVRDLAAAVLAGGEPVSLLLHGAPGTGKSEFARLLAARTGRRAVFVGLEDAAGGEPDRHDRLEHLALLRALAAGDAGTLLVVDEADDVLRGTDRDARTGSKLWSNLLVETPRVPTVWILNDPAAIDPSLVRRMALAVQFDLPPTPVRARIVRRTAATAGMTLAEAEVNALSALEAEPAILANGLRAARLAGGGAAEVQLGMAGVLRALGRGSATPLARDALFDPALCAADTDLALLANRLAAAPDRGWSLLLSGPSGTGKSAYARHLAAQAGLEVQECRGADLLDPFVGGTEAKIAGAFDRAAERGALLLIDEADSFLFRREAGQRSWEGGMVNEMLRAMERLRTPFVATTNLADRLDPATQRRFTLRATFRALDGGQAAALFARRFGMAPPPGSMLAGQTPGDFALVARRAALLGERSPQVLVRWLREEAALRGEPGGPIGFVA